MNTDSTATDFLHLFSSGLLCEGRADTYFFQQRVLEDWCIPYGLQNGTCGWPRVMQRMQLRSDLLANLTNCIKLAVTGTQVSMTRSRQQVLPRCKFRCLELAFPFQNKRLQVTVTAPWGKIFKPKSPVSQFASNGSSVAQLAALSETRNRKSQLIV